MASWRKALAEMADDPRPNNYRYREAERILRRLGFDLATGGDGSHRLWKAEKPDGTIVRIGLVDAGSGPMLSVYVKKMIATLREHGFYPLPESDNDMDE